MRIVFQNSHLRGNSLYDSGVGVARTRNKADDDEGETPPSSSNRSPEAKKNSDHDLESAMPLLETDEEGDGNDRTLTMTDLPHIECEPGSYSYS